MAYTATVLRVMIASPGDVDVERTIVRDTLHEWNDLNSLSGKAVLMPVGWDTHSTPDLGERAQSQINKRVLKNCDLLVGIFWTRIGTKTGQEDSGTVEEIKEHIKDGKPAMVYFSAQPLAPGSYDVDQFNSLLEFREWCKAQGLINFYDTPDEFGNNFRRHIQIILRDNSYLNGLAQQESSEAPPLTRQGVLDSKGGSQIEYDLSAEAIDLLLAAAQDQNGQVLKMSFIGGQVIQSNSQSFAAEKGSPRDRARWEFALSQLVDAGLLEERGHKGQVFSITNSGYEVADQINKRRQGENGAV